MSQVKTIAQMKLFQKVILRYSFHLFMAIYTNIFRLTFHKYRILWLFWLGLTLHYYWNYQKIQS
jgi:hypothetical protein